jgi:hypothetical protein
MTAMMSAIDTYERREDDEARASYYEGCVHLMDADLIEEINDSRDWDDATDREYLAAYCAAHERKFGEVFVVG